jgi:hypothetical protein
MRREKITHDLNSNTFNIVPVRSEVLLTQEVEPNKNSFEKFFWSASSI